MGNEQSPIVDDQTDGLSEPFNEVTRDVETIISKQLPNTFYRYINPSEEFGVSRFVADRMYHLPKLLENTTLTNIHDNTYLISAELKDSAGNSIRLEHRFKATKKEEAQKVYDKVSSQLAGIQQKIWLACWSLANKLHRLTFQCLLADLMKIVYPDRKNYFSVSERTEFYEHLKSLEQTKIIFSKPQVDKKKKKVLSQAFEIPLLQIISTVGEEAKYPQQMTISIMNPFPNPGKMAFIGAAFKHATLELHADDTQLATWIQTRKSQRNEENFISVPREDLIKLAGLERTFLSNKTVANKKLRIKLQRLVEKGIIAEAPLKIEEVVVLKTK